MNETMLKFIMKPIDADLRAGLSKDDAEALADILGQLRRLGILIEPDDVKEHKRMAVVDGSSSMTHLAIFVTTKCNLACTYCYARGGESEQSMSRDTWLLAMDYFFANLEAAVNQRKDKRKNLNLAIHGGGEPTVEFDLLRSIVADFSDRACAMGLQPSVGMGTNGTYGDAVHQWIIDKRINVNISLDGPREVQNHQRPFRSGQPSYGLVERNIRRLVQAGRRVSIRATVTDEALQSMAETVVLAKRIGAAAVHFEPVSLTGRCTTSGVAKPDAEKFADVFLKCFLRGLELDIDVRYSGMRCFEQYHQRFCSACGQNFCVTPDGNITACYEVLHPDDPAASEFFIGRIDPIRGLVTLDQERIQQLKQRTGPNVEACKDCFLRYHCAGDCPVKSFRYSNRDLYSPDPYRCQIADRVNKQLIAWLADGVIEPRDVGQTQVSSLNQGLA